MHKIASVFTILFITSALVQSVYANTSEVWTRNDPGAGSGSTGVNCTANPYHPTCAGDTNNTVNNTSINTQGQSAVTPQGQSAANPQGQAPAKISADFKLFNPLDTSIEGIFRALLDILMVFAVPIIVFFIVWAGFLYATAAGSQDKITKATRALTYAVIGGVIVLGANVLLAVITNTFSLFG